MMKQNVARGYNNPTNLNPSLAQAKAMQRNPSLKPVSNSTTSTNSAPTTTSKTKTSPDGGGVCRVREDFVRVATDEQWQSYLTAIVAGDISKGPWVDNNPSKSRLGATATMNQAPSPMMTSNRKMNGNGMMMNSSMPMTSVGSQQMKSTSNMRMNTTAAATSGVRKFDQMNGVIAPGMNVASMRNAMEMQKEAKKRMLEKYKLQQQQQQQHVKRSKLNP